MTEGYFSKHECAGGCGSLLPQHIFDAGRRYLWGHKRGCPKDGESPRRKPVTRDRPAARGPVVATSYERTLEMVKANCAACSSRYEELRQLEREVAERTEIARAKYERELALLKALEAVLGLQGVSQEKEA